jgi:3',5'-cyclic AMP phosphodiesterase CpdA
MRIAHVTDIHVHTRPQLRECFGKRFLGLANLYLAGRRGHFTWPVQEALVRDVARVEPDAVICSGDLTALSTNAEFRLAHELLEPLFSARPCALIPGNHDTYVPAAERERHIERLFGEWTGTGDWPRLHLLGDEAAVLALDVCRARPISTRGEIDGPQLDRIEDLMGDTRLDDRALFVMLHYPLRDRRGNPYGPPSRSIANAAALEAALLPHAPRIAAIVHGHAHHGFRTALPNPDGPDVPVLNPGAAGYAWLPKQDRTAHFCVYTVGGGEIREIERFAFDGNAFVPEPGGAWATGR